MHFKKIKLFQFRLSDFEKSRYSITKVGKDYVGIVLYYYILNEFDLDPIYNIYTSLSLIVAKSRVSLWWNMLIAGTWLCRLLRKLKLRRSIDKLTTGNGGLSSLVWVHQQLPKVYDYVLQDQSGYKEYNKYICVFSWDSRREKIYDRYLTRLGYERSLYKSEKILKLKIQDAVECDQVVV